MSVKPFLLSLLEWFIPAALRADADQLRRARMLVIGCLGSAALAVASNGMRRGAGSELPEATIVVLAGAAAWALVPLVLRLSRSLRVASALPATIGLAIIAVVAYYEDGPNAPVLLFAPLVPLVAIFLQGTRAGVAYAGLVAAVLLAYVSLDVGGHSFPDASAQAESFHLVRPLILTTVTLMATFFAWLYERQRRRSEAQLAEGRELYMLAARASSDGLFDWDMVEDETVYTERAGALLGWRASDGRVPSPFSRELVAAKDYARVRAELERGLAIGDRVDVETRLQTGAGQGWFEISGLTQRDAQGRPRRMVGAIRDISHRKEVERLKDEFVATVSHELRTPLASMLGAVGLVRAGITGPVSEESQEMIELAHRNGETLAALVNDLLDAQKLKDGSFVVRFEGIDVNRVAEEAIAANRQLHSIHGSELALVQRAPAATVRGDARRLQQVLTNLLSNAAKYSPPGGRVEISVTRTDDRVRCAVADQGPGIPAHFRDHVFEPFAQADSSDTRKHGGTGLGLSIAKAIVELHGGTIAFDTEEGRGTTFFFELPLAG